MIIMYAIGRKGDIIIADQAIKQHLGEKKHIVLTPKDLAIKLVKYIENTDDLSILDKALKKEGEGAKVVFYRVEDVVVHKDYNVEEREETKENNGWTERWIIRTKCTTYTYLSGKTKEECEEEKEFWKREKVIEKEGVKIKLEETRWRRDADIIFDEKYLVTLSPEQVLDLLKEYYDKALKLSGGDDNIARSALKLWLAGNVSMSLANGECLPPLTTLNELGREIVKRLKPVLASKGYDVSVVGIKCKKYAEYSFAFREEELSDIDKKILDILEPRGGRITSKEGDAITEVKEYWSDCPFVGCYGTRKIVKYSGRTIADVLTDSEVDYIFDVVPMTIEEAVELADALLAEPLLTPEKIEEDVKESLESTLENIRKGWAYVAKYSPFINEDRVACWTIEYDCPYRKTGTEKVCVKTPYEEIRAPIKFGLVKKCYPTYGFMRDEECDYSCSPIEYGVIKTREIREGEKIEENEDIKHYVRGTQEARKKLEEKILDLLAAIA